MSIHTVCSDKLIRTKPCPVTFAKVLTRLVFPTPGLPSSKIGLGNCIARSIFATLAFGVAACKTYWDSQSSSPNEESTKNKLIHYIISNFININTVEFFCNKITWIQLKNLLHWELYYTEITTTRSNLSTLQIT